MNSTGTKQKSLKVNAVLNVIKQCSTIIFPLITYSYISRVLESSNFGRVSFASSIIEYGAVFAALGIPTYMVREGAKVRNNKDAIKQMTSEVFTISLITMLISIGGIAILTVLSPRLRVEGSIIGILGFNIVFSILGRDWINTIYEDYLYITIRYIALKFIALLLIFLFVKSPTHYLRYALIMLFSESGGYVLNMFYSRRYVPYMVTRRINIKKHIKPLLFLFCSTVAVRIYIQSDITILGFMRTDAEVGVYSLTSRIYSVIKSVLNAIILVMIPRISYYVGNGKREEYNQLLSKLKSTLMTLLFPCIVGGIALSKNVLYIMGGEQYIYGYRSFEILCIALLFAVLGCYYAQGVLIPNKQEKKYFICTSTSAIVNIVFNFIAIRYLGIEGAAITTLIAEVLIMLSCRHYSKGLQNEIDQDSFIPVIIGCIVIFAFCKCIGILHMTILFETFVSILGSVVVYFLILYFGKNKLILEILSSIRVKIRK